MNDRSESRDDWARARDVFLDLVDLDGDERDERLRALSRTEPEIGARVAALLAHDRPPPPPQPPAERFGPYRPIRRLGAGGMGEVWLGRRDDGEFEREVAIKILRAGLGGDEGIRRFQRERRLLAALDHEYIARLIDGGTTERGQPYFVLEYVEGSPLDVHCRRFALDLEQRLRLFLRVLAAVVHAHDHGVVHRDLKPGNVLVRADGSPRLLDFGISRLRDESAADTAPLTRAGSRMFTLEYASPEQVRGEEATFASDVYSLGVMLHELITDARPFADEPTSAALERAILDTTPRLPSRCVDPARRRSIEGDLDTIVAKCLRKEPWTRYPGVRELGEDLERHLSGEPIRARKTSVLERAAREVRKRPLAALAALAIVVVAAIGARLAFAHAEQHRAFLRATAARLDAAVGLREQGRIAESLEELEAILAALADRSGAERLSERAHVHSAIAANHLRRSDEALRHLDAAGRLLDPAPSETDDPARRTLFASFLNAKAYALSESGDLARGSEAANAAIAYCRAFLPPGDPRTIDALLELADRRRRKGVPTQEDFDAIDAVVAEARLRGNARDATLGSALNLAAVVRTDGYRYEAAIPLYQEAIDVLGWHHGEGQEPIAFLRTNLGDSYFRLARFDEARTQHERALAARRALGDRATVAVSLEHLARIAIDAREFDVARSRLDELGELVGSLYPESHPSARRYRLWSAILEIERGNVDPGCAAVEREIAAHGAKDALPIAHEAQGRLRLGRVLLTRGELARGRAEIERALPILENEYGPEHRDVRAAKELLAAN